MVSPEMRPTIIEPLSQQAKRENPADALLQKIIARNAKRGGAGLRDVENPPTTSQLATRLEKQEKRQELRNRLSAGERKEPVKSYNRDQFLQAYYDAGDRPKNLGELKQLIGQLKADTLNRIAPIPEKMATDTKKLMELSQKLGISNLNLDGMERKIAEEQKELEKNPKLPEIMQNSIIEAAGKKGISDLLAEVVSREHVGNVKPEEVDSAFANITSSPSTEAGLEE